MIERMNVLAQEFEPDAPKELLLLSFISQSFFQPFSLEDNLLAILSALTSGSGVGFNRAMLFLVEGTKLRGRLWLGPRSTEEAWNIWQVLSTPGIGYIDIIEHNRALLNRPENQLSRRVRELSFDLEGDAERIPSLATQSRNIILVRDAGREPGVYSGFRELIGLEEFLCIPLLARDEVLGEVILDNAITRAPIERRDIKLASLVGLIAGNVIAMARMHRRVTDMERLAAMGEMAAFLTHQLRNPLTAVGGFVDQMADPRASARKKKRNLHIIRSEIKRLEEIIFKVAHLGVVADFKALLPPFTAKVKVLIPDRFTKWPLYCLDLGFDFFGATTTPFPTAKRRSEEATGDPPPRKTVRAKVAHPLCRTLA